MVLITLTVVLVPFYDYTPNPYLSNQRETYSNYLKGIVVIKIKLINQDLRSYSMTCVSSATFCVLFLVIILTAVA